MISGNPQTETLYSAALTADAPSTSTKCHNAVNVLFHIKSGASVSVTPVIQGSMDGGVTWDDISTLTNMPAGGIQWSKFSHDRTGQNAVIPPLMRVNLDWISGNDTVTVRVFKQIDS